MTKETGESLAGAATAAGCGAEPAVHLFEREGIRVAVDRGSGAVHVVDRKVYELLLAGSTLEGCRRLAAERAAIATGRQRRRIVAAGRAIANLAAAGQLWGNGRELPADYRPPTVVKAMCLLVAHDCNLRCCYCFAGTGKFGGHRRLMSRETAERAVAFLFAASAGRRHVEIDFFGGEPMINLPVVRAAVAAVRRHEEKSGKRCRLTLTTNAFSVEEQDIVWLRDNQVALVLSCDGRPETHDRVRRDGNGRASHARVLDNIRRIVGIYHGENYYLRGTFTALNPDFAADVEYLLDQGFDRLSFEPVVTTIPGLALTGQHLPILDQQYRRLTDLYVRRHLGGRPFDYFHFNLDFAASQCEEKLAGGCGAGSQYLAVAADGDIYPCHQFAGGRTHRLGGLESGVTNWPLVEQLSRCHIFSGQDCRGCWARFFCGGGCAANNWSQTGNFTGQWRLGCDLLRQRCEWAIVVRAKIKLGAGEEGDGHDQDKMDE